MRISKEVVVGLLFLASLAILSVAMLTSRSPYTTAGHRILVRFDNVSGLRQGDEVRLSGRAVGFVESLRPLHGEGIKTVETVLQLDRPVQFYAGYRIAILDETTIGGRVVDIDVGDMNGRMIAQEVYRGTDASNPLSRFAGMADLFTKGGPLDKALDEFHHLLMRVGQSKGLLYHVIYDEALYHRVDTVLARFSTLALALGDPEAGVPAEIRKTSQAFRQILASLQKVMDKFDNGRGTLPKLVNDPRTYEQLTSILSEAESSGKALRGLLRRLEADPQLLLLGERSADTGFWRGTILGRGLKPEQDETFEPQDTRARGPK